MILILHFLKNDFILTYSMTADAILWKGYVIRVK